MQKSELLECLQINLRFIAENIDGTNHTIRIHIQDGNRIDRTRTAFVLYTLGRALRRGIPMPKTITRDVLIALFSHLFAQSKELESLRNHRVVELYGMRFLKELGEDMALCIDSFKERSYADLFTYPVTTYLFLSAYVQCPELREAYPFSISLRDAAVANFDYLLFSQEKNRYRAFHFAELSQWKEEMPADLYAEAERVMSTFFVRDVADPRSYSSGIAKCMEHFSRNNDTEMLDAGFAFLKKRRINAYAQYLRPDLVPYAQDIFAETEYSQYINLDTSAHLVHTCLNLYEKL